MRVPLDAHQTVTLTHIVRKGTMSDSYTVLLSGVSCHETNGVLADGGGFSHSDNSTSFCIFPMHTTAAFSGTPEQASIAGSTYLAPAAFKAADPALRGCRWTLAPEDKVLLPSGRTGTVASVQDNRTGRCPHWYVEVSG